MRTRPSGRRSKALAPVSVAKSVYRQPEQIDSTIKQGSQRITHNLTRWFFERHSVFLIFVSRSACPAG